MNKEEKLKKCMGIVAHLAYKYRHSIYDHDYEDLKQEGLTWLWSKLDNYNPKRARVETYAYIVVSNKFENMRNSKHNIDYTPIDYDEQLGNELYIQNTLSPSEMDAIEYAFEALYDSEKSDVITRIMNGEVLRSIADDYEVSTQRVHQIWKEFINEIKGEI